MAYRTVMSLDTDCYKCKQVALHSVTKIEGIDTISINMKEKTITVDGDADPVGIAKKIKSKLKHARLLSTGPILLPPPPPPTSNVEKKNDEERKVIISPMYPPCTDYCSCAPPQYCECSTCSIKSDILWPGYRPPKPPANEVWHISNDENPSSCTIC